METYPTTGKYILNDDHSVTACSDLIVWGKWFEKNHEKKIVKRETVCGLLISTVFLGMDHGFGFEDGRPILFESMIFNRASVEGIPDFLDDFQERCSSYAEALRMHQWCKLLVQSILELKMSFEEFEKNNPQDW